MDLPQNLEDVFDLISDPDVEITEARLLEVLRQTPQFESNDLDSMMMLTIFQRYQGTQGIDQGGTVLVDVLLSKIQPEREDLHDLFLGCVRNGMLSVAKHLVARHNIDVNFRPEGEYGALFHAVRNHHADASVWLVEDHGQDVCEVNCDGETVFEYAKSCASGSEAWLRENYPRSLHARETEWTAPKAARKKD